MARSVPLQTACRTAAAAAGRSSLHEETLAVMRRCPAGSP
jgi:hypothetical protein